MKVAKIVKVCLVTRVVVEENATQEEILQKCGMAFKLQVNEELSEHLDSIEPDVECPFGTLPSDNR
jgi:hypothetical protein